MITLDHVSKTYDAREGAHHALRDVSLHVDAGDVFGIIGQSGAGKSTLVRCINLLERPTSGRVLVDGADVTDYSGARLRELRRGIGMVFQNFSLFQQRTVVQNVTFPLEIGGTASEGPRTASAMRDRAMELLDIVGLSAKAASYPSELSGGQQQRVAIARALASSPRVILCDEATSALDTRTTVSILNLLEQINRELGVTLVVITHSLAVARRICNRIAVLDDGRIVEHGDVADVLSNPASSVTRELLEFDGLASAGRVER